MDESGSVGAPHQSQINIAEMARILEEIKKRAENAKTEQDELKDNKKKQTAAIAQFKSSVDDAAKLLDDMERGQDLATLERELMEIMPQSCPVEFNLPQGMPGIHDLPENLKQEYLVSKQIVKSHELATVIAIEPTQLKFLQNRLRVIVGMCAAKILDDKVGDSKTAFKCIMTVNMSMRMLHSPATYELLQIVFGPTTKITPVELNNCVSTLERFAELACIAVINHKETFIDMLFDIVLNNFTAESFVSLTATLGRLYVTGRLVEAVAPSTTSLLTKFVGFGIPMVSLTVEMYTTFPWLCMALTAEMIVNGNTHLNRLDNAMRVMLLKVMSTPIGQRHLNPDYARHLEQQLALGAARAADVDVRWGRHQVAAEQHNADRVGRMPRGNLHADCSAPIHELSRILGLPENAAAPGPAMFIAGSKGAKVCDMFYNIATTVMGTAISGMVDIVTQKPFTLLKSAMGVLRGVATVNIAKAHDSSAHVSGSAPPQDVELAFLHSLIDYAQSNPSHLESFKKLIHHRSYILRYLTCEMVELMHAFSRMIAPSGVWHDKFDKSDSLVVLTDSPPQDPASLETLPFVGNGMAYVPIDPQEIRGIYNYFERQSIFWDLNQAKDWCSVAGRQAPTDAQSKTAEAQEFQAHIKKWNGWFKLSCEPEERAVRSDEVPPLSPQLLKLFDKEYEAAKERILSASEGTPAALHALLVETERAVNASNEEADTIVAGSNVDAGVVEAGGDMANLESDSDTDDHVPSNASGEGEGDDVPSNVSNVSNASNASNVSKRGASQFDHLVRPNKESKGSEGSEGSEGGKSRTRRRRPATAKRSRRKAYNKKSNKRKSRKQLSRKKISRRRQSRRK